VVTFRNLKSLEPLRHLKFDARHADLNDRDELRAALLGVDAVINCAGYYPTVPRPWRDEVRTATCQMDNFYSACADLPLRKIVYLGAAMALPRDPEGQPDTEVLDYSGEPRDKNPYLQVKWALDVQARAKAKAGLPVTIAIPTMSFGEFDPGNTTGRFILETANGTLPGYVNGRRNVIYAGDAGRGLVRVCEAGRLGERYLLSGENLTMQQILSKIAEAAGTSIPRTIPLRAAKMLSAWQRVLYSLGGPVPKVSASAIAVMSSGQFIDGTKASTELDFTPQVSVNEAIKRALHWFQGQGL